MSPVDPSACPDPRSREHELKVWPVFFDALMTGIKNFEIRSAHV